MAGRACWAVVGLTSLLGVLLSPVEAIILNVEYPMKNNRNFSIVRLSCVNGGEFMDPLSGTQLPATFLRNGEPITADSVVSIIEDDENDATHDEITFVFDQSQEGSFSCKTALNEPSNAEELAATPPQTALTSSETHYVLFSDPNTVREVELICPIKPGVLSDKYTVEWQRLSPTFVPLSRETNYTVTVEESGSETFPSIPTGYQCEVIIQHNRDEVESYRSSEIVVEKRVLSTLAQIEDASVAIGDPANFTCNAERRDTGFSISWKVDGRSYTCDASDANSEDNHCFTNDTLSVLRIQDTTSLGTGSHTVECILDHSIPPEFENDCSLLPDPQCDDVIRSATLNLEPTIVSTMMPTATLTPPPPSGSIVGIAAGAAGGAGSVIALVVVIALALLLYCFCIRRQRGWSPLKIQQRKPEVEDGIEMVPQDPHVSPNKQFHAEGTPLFKRQNANQPNGSRNLDVDDIYNGGSMMSGRSGISGLSEDDSMSCPPSPNVSSCQEEDDAERAQYEEPGYYNNQGRVAPSISITNEQLQFSMEPTGEVNGYSNGQLYNGSSGGGGSVHHMRDNSNLSHTHSSSHAGLSQTSYTGIPNLFNEFSQSDRYYNQQDHPTGSLWVPKHCSEHQRGSNRSIHSEPIGYSAPPGGRSQTLGPQSEYRGHSASPRGTHDERHHRNSRQSHSDQSDRQSEHHSGYHSDYIDDPHHHKYHHHHHDNENHRHKSKSRSRSRSPKYPSHNVGQGTPPSLRLGGHQYLSHRTLPNEGRTAFQSGAAPMRQSRSDDFGRSGTYGYYPRNHAPRTESQSNLSDTESWVASTQRLPHTSEAHPPLPPQSHPSHSSHSSHSTSGSDPIKESPIEPPQPPPPPPPTAAESPQIMDRILLEAVGCLMHQENCRITRCPCREVKIRFKHIIPQTRVHIQQEAARVTEDLQSGNFDPSDRRQQMRLSLSSQNFSPDIHAHYHMTSRSHIRQSRGMNRLKYVQRRRSKSMDLTPVMEQPGESCATTPGVVFPDSAKELLCGSTFSPAVTPSGETLRILSPGTPSAGPLAPPVLLREISLSADNLPALCLNDCPIAATPLMHLGNRPLGSNLRSSPLSTNQQRYSKEPHTTTQTQEAKTEDSPSSDEGHASDRYTSQESSSSIHTTSTQSSGHSGKNDGGSVFDDSALPNRSFSEQMSTSTTDSNPETSLRRKHFQLKGKQEEIEISQQGSRPSQYQHLESGYSTNSDGTDPESSLFRSQQRPGDLPIPPFKTRPLTPKKAPPTSMTSSSSSREPSGHLIPNGRQRKGSTSSHGSHTSHNSHISHASDGSTVTETLC